MTKKTDKPKEEVKQEDVIELDAQQYIDYKIRQYDLGINLDAPAIYLMKDVAETTLYELMLQLDLVIGLKSVPTVDAPLYIDLIINSPGGSVYEMIGLVDYFEILKKQNVYINTIAIGEAMSAGALLLCAGTGKRKASRRCSIMLHEMSSMLDGKSSDIKTEYEQLNVLEGHIYDILSTKTCKSTRFWKSKFKTNLYLTAQQALDYGIIDEII